MAVKFLQGLWYNPPSERNGLYQNCAGQSTNIFAMLMGESNVASPSHPHLNCESYRPLPQGLPAGRQGRGGREEVLAKI